MDPMHRAWSQVAEMPRRPELTIVIKALNEARNIGRTVECARQAAGGFATEVILADSLSEDDTVAIALSKGAKAVQLDHAQDRSCGAGPQLGYQYAQGDFIFLVDGDMEIVPGFIEQAIALMRADEKVAGVGGLMEEMTLDNKVFAARLRRNKSLTHIGNVDRLDGGGIYRRSALAQVGYFSNRNLHSYEELELGCRLLAAGWRLVRIASPSVRHYGHPLPRYRLLMRRYRSRYAWGPGELLRAALGKPWFARAAREVRAYLVVLAGWLSLMVGLLLMPWSMWPLGLGLAFQPALLVGLVLKRASLADGVFTYASWNVFALGTIRGFIRAQVDPDERIPSRWVHVEGARFENACVSE